MTYCGSDPVPYWRRDPDYYGPKDPRRAEHLRHLEINNRITARICASSGDGSYSIQVTRREID